MRKKAFFLFAFLAPAALSAEPVMPPAVTYVNPSCSAPSADYVPGIDAYGRPVAPADVDSGVTVTPDLRNMSVEGSPNSHHGNRRIRDVSVGVTVEKNENADCYPLPPSQLPAPPRE